MHELNCTQGEAQRLIDRGRLLADGVPMIDKSAKIHGEVEMVVFEPESRDLVPIYITDDFLVYDKPSGILVHPNKTQSPYTMLDEIRYHSGPDANAVHRIDQETSGLLLASRHKHSERILKNLFEQRGVTKSYLAWVDGRIDTDFEVEAPIAINGDYSATKHKVLIDQHAGKYALTKFSVVRYDQDLDATLLKCYPFTGRTHQIRVHLFHVKHPILGDPIYTTTFDITTAYLEETLTTTDRMKHTGASRLMLHAQTLEFDYDGEHYLIESRFEFGKLREQISALRELHYY